MRKRRRRRRRMFVVVVLRIGGETVGPYLREMVG